MSSFISLRKFLSQTSSPSKKATYFSLEASKPIFLEADNPKLFLLLIITALSEITSSIIFNELSVEASFIIIIS